MENPTKEIEKWAMEAGFDVVDFSPATTHARDRENLKQFNEQKLFGTMDWMQRHEDRRSHPNTLWPQAKSIIVLGMNYGPDQDPLSGLGRSEEGLISAYAKNRDYHDVIKKRLKAIARKIVATWPEEEVKVFVDTAPVMEKPIAAQTQLGWQGKHTCIVSPEFGSWLFLGEIFTTLELEYSSPHQDQCGTCTACLDICPTDAFIGPGKLDARKCISYLNIEYDGVIDPELADKMGNRIYGCDDCLAICPWNKFAKTTPHEAFQERDSFKVLQLDDLIMLDDQAFRDLFTSSPIKRIKWFRFIRNVLIAIGNRGESGKKERIQALCGDKNPVVRETARMTFDKLWPS